LELVNLRVELPTEVVDEIVERVAEIVAILPIAPIGAILSDARECHGPGGGGRESPYFENAEATRPS